MEVTDGARGSLLGAEYRCSHGRQGGAIVYRIVGAETPRELTTVAGMPGGLATYETFALRSQGARTEVEVRTRWFRPRGPAGLVAELALRWFLRRHYRDAERELRAILAERR